MHRYDSDSATAVLEADETTSDLRGSHSSRSERNLSARARARRESILEAAEEVFAHYGFRGASMRQIAQESEISRPALYQYFSDKEDVFRAMVEGLQLQTLEIAQQVSDSAAELESRIFGILDARLAWYYERLHASRHGLELVSESSRVAGDISDRGRIAYEQILTGVLARALEDGEIELAGLDMDPESAAQFVIECGVGLAGTPTHAPTPLEYRRKLRQLARTFLRGARA